MSVPVDLSKVKSFLPVFALKFPGEKRAFNICQISVIILYYP
jgi:hypothetical protein